MDTIDTINYIYDIQIEYNIKLMLLGLMALYSLFSIWYFRRYEPQYLWQYYFQHITLVLSKVYIFVGLPLWIFFLSRNITMDVILRPVLVVYGVASILFMIFTILYGSERIKKFFTGEGFYRNRK